MNLCTPDLTIAQGSLDEAMKVCPELVPLETHPDRYREAPKSKTPLERPSERLGDDALDAWDDIVRRAIPGTLTNADALKEEMFRRGTVPLGREALRALLASYVGWHNEHRPHQGLRGRTPNRSAL